jgi:hypothetical protein
VVTGSSRSAVDRQPRLGNSPPWLHPHYQASSLLRGDPPLGCASVLYPLRWLPLGGLPLQHHTLLAPGPGYRSTGSHVPCRSPSQAHATSTPDTVWAASRRPPGSSRATRTRSVSMSVMQLSTRHQWFTRIRLPDPHLPSSWLDFSATLTTPALYRRSLRWFEASPAGRLRRTYLHLLHSTAVGVFIYSMNPPSAFVFTLRAYCIRPSVAVYRSR